MRILHESSKGFTLEFLGFHGEGLESLHKAIRRPLGMILATGPTVAENNHSLHYFGYFKYFPKLISQPSERSY